MTVHCKNTDFSISSGSANTPSPWRRLIIGEAAATKLLQAEIHSGSIHLDGNAARAFKRKLVTIGRRCKVIALVLRWVDELGLDKVATYAQICTRARQLGLALCPAEVGLQLRLSYREQPEGERLCVAMPALTLPDRTRIIFTLAKNQSRLVLGSELGDSYRLWYPDHRFVFVARVPN